MRRAAVVAAGAAALVVLLVLILGGGSSVDPPADRAAALVPADARSFVDVVPARKGWGRIQRALRELPAISAQLPQGLSRPPAWLGGEAAVADTAAGRQLLLAVGDRRGAEAFARANHAEIERGFVVVGPRAAPARASLARTKAFRTLRAELPADRVAEAYLSDRVVPPELTALTGPPAADAAMISLGVSKNEARMALRSLHGQPPPGARPCERPRAGNPRLVGSAPSNAAGYLELAGADCLLGALDAPRLRRVAGVLRRRGGVDLGRQVLPLLAGQTAVNAADLETGPGLTLVADGVPRDKGLAILGRMQPALVSLLGPRRLVQAPEFEAAQAGGVSALTAVLAPSVQLSYAAFGNKVVVSTALAGIEAATRKGDLAQSGAYRKVLGSRPENASFVLFVDLEQLLALQEQAGLAADPGVLAIRDDLQKLRAAGAFLAPHGKTQTQGELRFTIP